MRLTQWIGLVVLVVAFVVFWQLQQLVLLAFTGVVLAVALNRGVRFFAERGIARPLGIGLTLGAVGCFLAVAALIVGPPLVEQSRELWKLLPSGIEQLRGLLDWVDERVPFNLTAQVADWERLLGQARQVAPGLFNSFFAFFSNSFNAVLNIVLVVVIAIMLLVQPEPYRNALLAIFPAFYRPRVEDVLIRCERDLGGWLTGIFFSMTVLAVLSGLGLWLLGVPLVLTHAVLAGLLTFIPNIGPILSVIPPATLALAQDPWKAAAVLVLYAAIQFIETNFLTPYVMEKQVSLLPAVTLVAQLALASFLGFAGLLLALPLVVVLQVWVQEVLIKDVLDRWD